MWGRLSNLLSIEFLKRAFYYCLNGYCFLKLCFVLVKWLKSGWPSYGCIEGAKKDQTEKSQWYRVLKDYIDKDTHQILLMIYLVPGTLLGSGTWREIRWLGEGANDSWELETAHPLQAFWCITGLLHSQGCKAKTWVFKTHEIIAQSRDFLVF